MIIIPGFTPDDKVPGAVAINEYGAGKLSVGAIALQCVLYGNMGSAGSATLNEKVPVTTVEEADAFFAPRSEIARMCAAALDVPGVTLMAIPVAEAAGAVAAQLVIDVGGTWGTSGEIQFQFDEEVVRVVAGASLTPTTFAEACVSAFNAAQSGRLFFIAANVAGKITLTVFSKGVRGNQHVAFMDAKNKPAGMTIAFNQHSDVVQSGGGPAITLSGTPTLGGTYVLTITTAGSPGTAQFSLTRNGVSIATGVTVPTTPFTYAIVGDTADIVTFENDAYVLNETYTWTATAALTNGGQPFHLGVGTDDLTAALDANETEQNDYIAYAHNDAVNVALAEASSNEKAAFDVGLLENYFVAVNRDLAGAIAIGQTTMNDQVGTLLWAQNHVEHPSRTAARVAALCSTIEGADPNHNYDDQPIPGAAPHFAKTDKPNRATLKSALNNSVSPLVTIDDNLVFVRLICSRSLNGATPDYRTYDRGDVAVAIRVRKELLVLAKAMKDANPYSGPDLADDLPPPGTLTPDLWISRVQAAMKEWEGPEFNWLEQVDANPPTAVWDKTAKRIMSVVPTIAKTQNHQIGIIVRQQAA